VNPNVRRFASSALLACGVLFVFLGLSAALGFTVSGFTASLAVIAALVYSGAVWFAPQLPSAAAGLTMPMVFDGEGRIAGGPRHGEPLSLQFPRGLRNEVERCRSAAFAGTAARFSGDFHGRAVAFECVPVRRGDGSIVYGILVAAEPIGPWMQAVTEAGLRPISLTDTRPRRRAAQPRRDQAAGCVDAGERP